MSPRSRPRGVLHIAMVSAAALTFMTTGCSVESSSPQVAAQSDEDEIVSCGFVEKKADGTEEWVVLPQDHCDDDGDGHGGGGFIGVISSHSHDPHRNAYTTPGSRLPRAAAPFKGGGPVRWNDANARTAVGLPPSGKVATGPRATFNSGLGKGGASGSGGGGGGKGGNAPGAGGGNAGGGGGG